MKKQAPFSTKKSAEFFANSLPKEESEFSEFEKEKLNQLKDYSISVNTPFPPTYPHSNMLRQLQGNDYEIEKAFENCQLEINFKAKNLPVDYSDGIEKMLNTGFVYFHGRDNRFRPIIVFNPGRYNKEIPYEDWEKGAYFFVEYMINQCFIPGKIENWDVIADFSEMKPTNIPWNLKTIFNSFKGVYRCRL